MLFGSYLRILDASRVPQVTGGRPHSSRRRILFAGVSATVGWFLAKSATAAGNAKILSGFRAGSLQQVKSVVEVAGELKFNADGKEVKKLPMTVQADLNYTERFLPPENGLIRSVRQYSLAQAKMKINGQDVPQELRADRRLIGSVCKGDDFRLFSPQGPLTRDELEMLNTVGRTNGIMGLLSNDPVAPGESWLIPEAPLVQLLALDAINQHSVKAEYVEDRDSIALIRFEGKVTGAVNGVSSDIELKGSLNLDLATRRPTWLALVLKENRAIGHAQPGYEAIIKLRTLLEPATELPELGDNVLAGMSLKGDEGDLLVELTSTKAGYSLLLDRRWCTMVDRHEVAVMRYVDQGDLVAQCNMSPLPPLPKGEQLTLEGFQQDVQKSLGKGFREFLDASQTVNENGLAVLRISAAGNAQDVAVQYVYYHLTDNNGRRASLVFTYDADLAERFGGADRALVASFRFIEPTTTAKVPGKSVVAPARQAQGPALAPLKPAAR